MCCSVPVHVGKPKVSIALLIHERVTLGDKDRMQRRTVRTEDIIYFLLCVAVAGTIFAFQRNPTGLLVNAGLPSNFQ